MVFAMLFPIHHSQMCVAVLPALLVETLEDSIMSARQAGGEGAKGHLI